MGTSSAGVFDFTIPYVSLDIGTVTSGTTSTIIADPTSTTYNKKLNFQLEKGDTGAAGSNGSNGKNGSDGKDGKDGVDGKDGKDGTDGSSIADFLSYIDTAIMVVGGVTVAAAISSLYAITAGIIDDLILTDASCFGIRSKNYTSISRSF